MADLTAACGEKILNPDFLLQGGGQPFAEQKQQTVAEEKPSSDSTHNNNNVSSSNADKEATTTTSNGGTSAQSPPSEASGAIETEQDKQKQLLKQQKEAKLELGKEISEQATSNPIVDDYDPFEIMLKRPVITLYSQKMKGLKDLLLAEKLNTHAISLQVTAQSVASRKVRGVSDSRQPATISATITAITSTEGGLSGGGSGGSASNASSAGGDSIAASRPKRTRRE